MSGGVTADDLFAGAGGWDLAGQWLGIHARGVENMKEARATRDAAGLSTVHDDVWTYEPDGSASGLIASPPCQTFSAAGKGTGRAALDHVLRAIGDGAYMSRTRLRGLGMYVGDDRTALVLTPLHFAMTGGYEWLAWEQVPTVLPVWEACAAELREHGWHTWTGLLHAEQYGVPQTRKRALLLASRRGPVAPPKPTHSRYYSRDPGKLDAGVEKWLSMAEGLGWGMTHAPAPCVTNSVGRGLAGGSNSRKTLHRERAEGRWELPNLDGDRDAWREAGWGLLDRPAPTVTGGGTDAGGAEPIAKLVERWTTRPDWCDRRPSTTIVGTFKPEIVAAPGYRTTVSRQNAEGSVRVTVAEAGVLQSFPADYPWQGTKGKQFLQAGNAVPPGLALHALSAVTSAARHEAVA